MQKSLLFIFFASNPFHAAKALESRRAGNAKTPRIQMQKSLLFFFFASLRSSLRICVKLFECLCRVKLFECRVKLFEWLFQSFTMRGRGSFPARRDFRRDEFDDRGISEA
jgi:hypothetical protein